MIDHAQSLRDLASIETSCLYSQRKKLIEAADDFERLRAALQRIAVEPNACPMLAKFQDLANTALGQSSVERPEEDHG